MSNNEKILSNLHMHSSMSDGSLKPVELLELASKLGLTDVAITDHNFVHSESDMDAYRNQFPNLNIYSGCEISTAWDYNGEPVQIHIVAVGFDPKKLDQIVSKNKASDEDRENYFNAIRNRLANECNILIPTHEEMLIKFNKTRISRMEINQVLVENNIVKTIDQAFDEYTGTYSKQARCYVNEMLYTNYISVEDAISAIKAAGGYSILAHPVSYRLDDEGVCSLIQYCTEQGVDGVELDYYSYGSKERELIKQYMDEAMDKTGRKLVISSASDFHRPNDENRPMATMLVEDYDNHIISLLRGNK